MQIKTWRQFDYLMLLIVLALIGYGLLMIYSATLSVHDSGDFFESFVFRQGMFAFLGLVLLVVVISFDYELLGNLAVPLYALGLLMLAAVLILGRVTHGSQRWIDLGFTTLEPSEPAKLILAVCLAKYLSDHEEDMFKFRTVVISALIVAPYLALTAMQPHLGNSIVYLVIWFGILVMAGLRFFHAVIMGIIAAVSAPIAWIFFLQGYMQDRVTTFLNPQARALDEGYNIIQALISVGSGGIWGRGFTSGTQSQLHFLRVQYADFIFSVLAEELGFIGALALFVLFVSLLFRAMRASSLARDGFGRLLATGIVSMLTFQIFVNVGINIGLLPVSGLPLPFISYGGTYIVLVLIAVGILESIVMRRSKADF